MDLPACVILGMYIHKYSSADMIYDAWPKTTGVKPGHGAAVFRCGRSAKGPWTAPGLCRSKKCKWWKFPEPSITASLVTIYWLCNVKIVTFSSFYLMPHWKKVIIGRISVTLFVFIRNRMINVPSLSHSLALIVPAIYVLKWRYHIENALLRIGWLKPLLRSRGTARFSFPCSGGRGRGRWPHPRGEMKAVSLRSEEL